jgi:polyisoprenoid-binding protein YceI
LAAVLALSAAVAAAEPVQYKIDPGHSLVGFNIRHFFSRTPGRFKDFSGTIMLDEKNLAASSVDVTIQAASINTEHERRDSDLRGPNFFNTDTFPTLTFKSTKVVAGPEKSFLIYGDLMIRGVTKPVTLQASLTGIGDVGMTGRPARRLAGFDAKTTINRKDYGIVWYRVLDQGGSMLGDDVEISLQIEAAKFDPNAAPPPAPATAPAAEKK